jgi:hypothetical protein
MAHQRTAATTRQNLSAVAVLASLASFMQPAAFSHVSKPSDKTWHSHV